MRRPAVSRRQAAWLASLLLVSACGSEAADPDQLTRSTDVKATSTSPTTTTTSTTTTTTTTSTTTTAALSTTTDATTSATESPANELCIEAFQRAAAVSDFQDEHADLFPVFVHCSLQEAIDVGSDYSSAFDTPVDEALVADWCFFQSDSQVRDATFLELVEGVGGTIRDTALCQEVLGPRP